MISCTIHFIIIFYDFFFGGGAQNLSLPPGASYPRYATATRAGTIHPTHFPIRFTWSRFDSIQFDSNEYIIDVNRYSINHFVPIS